MPLFSEPRIFKASNSVRAALTLRGTSRLPYGFNMSLSVGDSSADVQANRERAARRLGFAVDRLATQRQVHGSAIRLVDKGYQPGESDALVTNQPGWLLAVSVADCVPILVHDPVAGLVAGVHSGWRGTLANIVGATLELMHQRFGSRAGDMLMYVGASAGQCCYEVGEDVAGAFDAQHSRPLGGGKFLFDNRGAILAQLLAAGVPPGNIEMDPRCTICDANFHSFRRDGAASGRMFALIGMVGNDART